MTFAHVCLVWVLGSMAIACVCGMFRGSDPSSWLPLIVCWPVIALFCVLASPFWAAFYLGRFLLAAWDRRYVP